MKIETQAGYALQAELNEAFAAIGFNEGTGSVLAAFTPCLTEHAANLCNLGVSYRGFLVGGCAVAFAGGNLHVLEGVNHSPRRGAVRNCAEMGLLAAASEHAVDSIESIYLAGPSDPEIIAEVCGVRSPTLPPCEDCRQLLHNHPATTPEMPIHAIAPETGYREKYTLRTLLERYRDITPPPTSAALMEAGS